MIELCGDTAGNSARAAIALEQSGLGRGYVQSDIWLPHKQNRMSWLLSLVYAKSRQVQQSRCEQAADRWASNLRGEFLTAFPTGAR
jgi:hypothetical protein